MSRRRLIWCHAFAWFLAGLPALAQPTEQAVIDRMRGLITAIAESRGHDAAGFLTSEVLRHVDIARQLALLASREVLEIQNEEDRDIVLTLRTFFTPEQLEGDVGDVTALCIDNGLLVRNRWARDLDAVGAQIDGRRGKVVLSVNGQRADGDFRPELVLEDGQWRLSWRGAQDLSVFNLVLTRWGKPTTPAEAAYLEAEKERVKKVEARIDEKMRAVPVEAHNVNEILIQPARALTPVDTRRKFEQEASDFVELYLGRPYDPKVWLPLRAPSSN